MNCLGAVSKLQAVRQLAEREHASILVTQQKNLSWLFSGRSHVNIASEPGCCNFLIAGDKCVLVANNIEAKRLLEEEMQGDFLEEITDVEVWDWFHPKDRERLIAQHVILGTALKTDVELEADFFAFRSVLDEFQANEIKQIGRLAAEAIEQTAQDIKRGDTEFAIAGRLAYRCWERGLDPIVNLIAVDERTRSRRHPQPTGKALDTYAMLVVCTRRNGLIASATRLVHFGAVPEEIKRKYQAVAEIDTRIIDTATAGKTLGDIFTEIKQFYREAGYPEEYRQHHQGGLTGFATREKLSTPQEMLRISSGQLYAWNPSIAGVKSEDTILVGTEKNEIITPVSNYPKMEIAIGNQTYIRPGILQRPI